MRIAICEDDSIHAQILMHMIAQWQEKTKRKDEVVNTEVFQSAEQFLCSMDEHTQSEFDLAFLDIGLKRMDGMELAKRLRKENDQMILVFTTADALSAPKGYEVDAFRYLVKPLHADQVEHVLTQAYDKIQTTSQKTKKDALILSYDGETHRIWKQDIYYIEATGHYVEIHTDGRSIRVRSRLDAFESELKAPQFCRCHRAFLCNLYYAETMNKDTICMTDGTKLPVSRSRQRTVNECMIAYYTEQL